MNEIAIRPSSAAHQFVTDQGAGVVVTGAFMR
jgi:hypothetical protein